jgi:nucleotide-binding universal stress UspA family protein
MIRKILLGYDGSESARSTAESAIEFARRFTAELHIVAVVQEPPLTSDVEVEGFIEGSRKYYDRLLAEMQSRLSGEPFTTHVKSLVGHPAEQLIYYAETNEIDHIVIGHRGHSILSRFMIGSVAHRVLIYAHCAVTVVRGKQP